MSMTREAAIKHFLSRKYSEMRIGEAFAAAPASARNGLHEADANWIKRYRNVGANDAVKRLLIRSRARNIYAKVRAAIAKATGGEV